MCIAKDRVHAKCTDQVDLAGTSTRRTWANGPYFSGDEVTLDVFSQGPGGACEQVGAKVGECRVVIAEDGRAEVVGVPAAGYVYESLDVEMSRQLGRVASRTQGQNRVAFDVADADRQPCYFEVRVTAVSTPERPRGMFLRGGS